MIEDILKAKTIDELKKDLEDKKDISSREFLLHILTIHPDKFKKVQAAFKNLNSWLHPFDMDEEIREFFEPKYKAEKTYFELHKMMSMLFLFELAGIGSSHFTIDIYENQHTSGSHAGEKFMVYTIKRNYRKDD